MAIPGTNWSTERLLASHTRGFSTHARILEPERKWYDLQCSYILLVVATTNGTSESGAPVYSRLYTALPKLEFSWSNKAANASPCGEKKNISQRLLLVRKVTIKGTGSSRCRDRG